MNRKTYNKLRALIGVFIAFIVSIAVMNDSYLLALTGILTGFFFMVIVRSKAHILVDERDQVIRQKAAQLTYAIFAPTIGIGAVVLTLPYQKISSVFAKGEFVYIESLGMVFAYLTLFLLTVYAISYYFLNRKYGGGGSEE